MKNKLIVILSAVTAILLVAIGIQTSAYKRSKEDVRVYRGNVDALMRDVEAYRTKDSMSVAKTNGIPTIRPYLPRLRSCGLPV